MIPLRACGGGDGVGGLALGLALQERKERRHLVYTRERAEEEKMME